MQEKPNRRREGAAHKSREERQALSPRIRRLTNMASETDPQGSYTGVPLLSDSDVPIQDADDL